MAKIFKILFVFLFLFQLKSFSDVFQKNDSLEKVLAGYELNQNISNLPAETLFNIGRIYENYKSDYNKAIEYYKLASEKAISENDTGYIKYESWLGYTLSKTGDIENAIQKLLSVIELAESKDYKTKLPRLYLLLAFSYRDAKLLDKSEFYFIKSIDASNTVKDSTDIHTALAEIGNLFSIRGDNKSALKYLRKALKIREQHGLNNVLVYGYHDISIIYLALDSVELSLKYLSKADSIASLLNEKWVMSSIYANYIDIYIRLKQISKAEPYLLKLKNIADELNLKSVYVTLNHSYYTYYKALNKSELALKYFELEQVYKDSISNQDIQKNISEFEKKYEIARKDKELLKTQEDVKRQKIILFSVIIGFIIVLTSLIIILKFYRKNKTAFEKLEFQNRKILKQKEELNELNSTKDKLFSIIAHDLRSPFVGIQGFSDLLLNSPEDYTPDETKLFIEQINISSRTTLDLLEKLLNWAKNQTGKISFNPEKINLQSIILECMNSLMTSAKIKSITMFCDCENDIDVFADRDMLRTVIRNLIQNSIKFTKPEGRISITAKRQEKFIEVSVKDNGIGMDENTLKNIFNITDKETVPGTANEKGTGLGLILCKDFVEKNGGTISVESTLGEGSCFLFTMPSI